MNRILVAVAVVVLLVAVALFQLCSRLDSLVASTIEREGSALTGTAVRVGSVDLDLREGRGSVRGLRIGNPEGFSSQPAISLGEITLQIDIASLTGTPKVVQELLVAEPKVNFEVDDAGRANIDVIRRNLAKGGRPKPSEEPAGEPVRLRIEKLAIEDGVVRTDATQVGGEERETRLPSVRLNGVGGARGATPADIGKGVLTAFVGQIARTVAKSELQNYLESEIDKNLGEVGEAAKGALRSILGGGDEKE